MVVDERRHTGWLRHRERAGSTGPREPRQVRSIRAGCLQAPQRWRATRSLPRAQERCRPVRLRLPRRQRKASSIGVENCCSAWLSWDRRVWVGRWSGLADHHRRAQLRAPAPASGGAIPGPHPRPVSVALDWSADPVPLADACRPRCAPPPTRTLRTAVAPLKLCTFIPMSDAGFWIAWGLPTQGREPQALDAPEEVAGLPGRTRRWRPHRTLSTR